MWGIDRLEDEVTRYLVLQSITKATSQGTNVTISPGVNIRFVDADNIEEAIGIFNQLVKELFNDYQKSSIKCYEIDKIQVFSKQDVK